MRKYLSKHYWVDKDIEVIIGKMLRTGVLIAATVSIIGGIMYLLHYGSNPQPSHSTFVGETTAFTSLKGVLNGAWHLSSRDIMQLGVLLLIATPIARIAFSVFAFLLEKDYMYVVITFVVLAIIFFSMLGGFAGA